MTRPRILVTGAGGKTGGAVAGQLAAAGHLVRAMVRSRDARALALEARGIETVVADLHDADQIAAALRDVQRVYYVPIFAPHAALAAMTFAAAVRASKVEAVVQLSQWLTQPAHPSILTRESWLIEQGFAMIPQVAHVIVNPGMFADNFLRVMDFATLLRVYPVLTGDSRSAPVATGDIARVVCALLQSPDRHAGMRYRPTGPALMSGRDIAAAIGRVLGHRVWPVDLPFAMFRKLARLTGVNPHEVFNYRDYIAEHRAGGFDFDGGVTDVVERLTGTPAETFEEAARHYAAMPFARPTLANRAAMLARMTVVPFWPGYDMKGYQRALALPVPPHPRLSVEDARWREERRPRRPARDCRCTSLLCRRFEEDAMQNLENRVPPPVLVLVLGLVMAGAHLAGAGPDLPPAVRWGLGLAAFAGAGVFGFPAFRAFARARTTINPVRIDAASALVTTGIYGMTRNPMYVALTLLLVAWAAGLGGVWLFAGPLVFVLWITRLQIIPEERVLRAKFGQDYAAYRSRVRRWI